MFNINGATKYKYIPNYHDMRGGYDKLSSVVREVNGGIMEDGIAFYDGKMTDMEREQYQNRINELLGALETMLDANKHMGGKAESGKLPDRSLAGMRINTAS